MNILIVGDQGVIGQSLVKRLCHEHFVRTLDFPELDLKDYRGTIKSFSNIQWPNQDSIIVINCTGLMGAKESQTDFISYLKVNGIGPLIIMDALTNLNWNFTFLQLSTETVYGQSQNTLFKFTEMDTPNPKHNYGLSKLVAEVGLENSKWKQRVIILRIPIVLSIPQKYPNTVSIIYSQIKDHKPLEVYGDGTHVRKYTTITWLCDHIVKVIEMNDTLPDFSIINIPGKSLSVIDFIHECEDYFQTEYEKKFLENHNLTFSLDSSHQFFENLVNTFYSYSVLDLIKYLGEK